MNDGKPGSAKDSSRPPGSAVTMRSIVVALGLAFLADLWMRQDQLVLGTIQLAESVPTIPAIAALLLFLLLNPLLGRLRPRLAFTRAEVMVVFIVVSLVTTINEFGVMGMFLATLPAAAYFAKPENFLADVWQLLPRWFAPQDPELARGFFEGHWPGGVPWAAWGPTLGLWLLFFAALFATLMGLSTLFRRPWTERERLTYPLMSLVTELTPGQQRRNILRDPFFWGGVTLSVLFNAPHMLHAYLPTAPGLGSSWLQGIPLGKGFVNPPWNALSSLWLVWRPTYFGIGYLMSTEVTFTIWASYLALRFSTVVAAAWGATAPQGEFPYDRNQGLGVFGALALILFWTSRRHLGRVFRQALRRGRAESEGEEPFSSRIAVMSLVGGFVFLIVWSILAGMHPTLALVYFGLIVAVALSYTRIRAETGAPMVWLFPIWEQEGFIRALWGNEGLLNFGRRSVVLLSHYTWLSRGFYPSSVMAIQMEGFHLADQSGLARRRMGQMLWLGLLAGVAMAFWIHLTTYYERGAAFTPGCWLVGRGSLQQAGEALHHTPRPPEPERTMASLVGFLLTLGLVGLRMRFLGFPFHPLGYAMTCAYGHPIWGASFMAWMVKRLVLRTGGARLYRQLIPLFVGIVVGHLFMTGVVWGIVGAVAPGIARNYVIFFG